jgi:hypothetical protein
MERKSYITRRFNEILKETINEKAEELMGVLKLNPPGGPADYVQEEKGTCNECGKPYAMMEGEEGGICECGDPYSVEVKERLIGNQKKLDKNKNGRLDTKDFAMMRDRKKKEMREYTMGDDKLEVVKPYGDFSTDSPEIKPGKNQVKNVGDKFQREVSKKFDDYELDETIYELELDETETDESREFAYAAMMAKKKGKKTFDLDGETFDVKNGKSKVEETYYRIKVDGEMATFSENEMIDIIEGIVKEEKDNLKRGKEPKGYAEYERVHKEDKKEGDKYFKELAKKMTDYTKDMSEKESKYEMEGTQKFPTENGGKRKKYTPSEAVEDYNDAFSYPGQTNLVYDEIKPNDEWIEANLKGSSKTGNAQVDKDGKALGNVVPSEVGEKFYKNFKDNLYGQEQMDASYKRQPQPVDQAGEETERGSLKSKRGKKTSQSVLNKVEESVNDKKTMKLNEEFSRMQELIGYSKKTQ